MRGRARWSRSLAAQVWLMVLLCAGAVLGLVIVNTQAEVRHERSVVGNDLLRQGRLQATSDSDSIKAGGETEQTLASIAEQPVIGAGGAGCAAALSPLQKAVSDGFVALVDARGTVLCAASPKDVRVGEHRYAGATALRRLVAAGKAGTDGPFVDAVTGELTMFTTVPVPGHPGTGLVFLLGSQAFFAPLDQEQGTTSIVVDGRTGTVLMHYPARPRVVGTSVASAGLGDVLGTTRISSATGPDGVKRLYRAIAITGSPYKLLVGVSQAASYAPSRASLRRNLWIAAGLVVVMVLMGLVLQRRVARPARALRGAIRSLAEDPEAGEAPTDGPTELADVALAFNDMADARRRADGLSRAILQHASDLLLVVTPGGTLGFVAPRARHVLGVESGAELDGLLARVHDDDRERVVARVTEWLDHGSSDLRIEGRLYDGYGVLRVFDVRVQDLRKDRYVDGLVVTCHDVTERKSFEQHLSYQARHDPLTGLANRAAVVERLAEDLDPTSGETVCVLFLDLDRFKLVNDSHGHAIGDKVLVALARTLLKVAPTNALVGRFGGDEFVVVTADATTPAAAEELAQRLRQTLEDPFLVGHRELFVSGSVGITIADPGDSPDQVLRNADTAMYRAKARGRNCSALFDEAMRADAQRLLRTESDLHRALERDQLALHFQPVVNLADGRVSGVEALVRWVHPKHGLMPPSDFIPVAEETGLVVPIGAWVMETACTWAARTGEALGIPLTVAVNVSPRQLAQPDVLDQVDRALELSGLPPERLTLEVTENLLVQDADVAERVLTAVHERGVRVSIDDFGTGWSSLTYLQRFPVDEIKLDRSYVSGVNEDLTSRTIVGSLLGMAHAMGLSVVAEGVERPEQAAFLRSHHCEAAQGYHFARPLPGNEVVDLLAPGGVRLPVAQEPQDPEERTAV